jgi:hypothetical protein
MFRSLLRLPSIVADYTVGTVIVLVQIRRVERTHAAEQLRLQP